MLEIIDRVQIFEYSEFIQFLVCRQDQGCPII